MNKLIAIFFAAAMLVCRSLCAQDRVGGCEVHRLEDGTYVMFYIGYSDVYTARIGVAFSKDGITGWERYEHNPIVVPDEDTWDASACYKP